LRKKILETVWNWFVSVLNVNVVASHSKIPNLSVKLLAILDVSVTGFLKKNGAICHITYIGDSH
jgi:hypothetical protein